MTSLRDSFSKHILWINNVPMATTGRCREDAALCAATAQKYYAVGVVLRPDAPDGDFPRAANRQACTIRGEGKARIRISGGQGLQQLARLCISHLYWALSFLG
jgi:hypothetical protein